MVGDLVVSLIARTDRFSRGMNNARRSMGSFVSSTLAGVGRVTAQVASLGSAVAVGIGSMAVKLAADAEQMQVSFEVMTGSAATATRLIEDLRKMGASTPFQTGDLMTATKTLLNFGRTSETVLDDLDMLSNVAAGDSEKLKSLALVFGQIASNGKLMGQDLLQLINAGFNPLLQISEKTGESMSSLRDRMSKGEISFDQVRQAFIDATSEGGRFYQMNEKQSKTLLGRWSTLKDNVTLALMEIGESLMNEFDLNATTEQVTEMVKVFKQDWMPTVVDGIKASAEFGKWLFEVITQVIDVIKEAQIQLAAFIADVDPQDIRDMLESKQFGAEVKVDLANADEAIENASKLLADPLKELPGGENSLKNIMEGFDDGLIKVDQDEMTKKFNAIQPEVLAKYEKEMPSFIAKIAQEREDKEKRAMESPTNQVRSLEDRSAEAFEVLRANVSPQKTQNEQLKEAKKQSKKLDEIKKAITDTKGPAIAERGFN